MRAFERDLKEVLGEAERATAWCASTRFSQRLAGPGVDGGWRGAGCPPCPAGREVPVLGCKGLHAAAQGAPPQRDTRPGCPPAPRAAQLQPPAGSRAAHLQPPAGSPGRAPAAPVWLPGPRTCSPRLDPRAAHLQPPPPTLLPRPGPQSCPERRGPRPWPWSRSGPIAPVPPSASACVSAPPRGCVPLCVCLSRVPHRWLNVASGVRPP